jgi:hypothetical protein
MPRATKRSKKPRKIKGITPTRQAAYRKLKGKGYSVIKSAKIANKGKTFAGRSEMAKKGARNRG